MLRCHLPWERYNRVMYRFNTKIDKYIAHLIGVTYDTVVPNAVQRRFTSFFANLQDPGAHDDLTLEFATFLLNRTNRSGILSAGVIGGKQQSGKWNMRARFNSPDLIKRIHAVARVRNRIDVHQNFFQMISRFRRLCVLCIWPPDDGFLSEKP